MDIMNILWTFYIIIDGYVTVVWFQVFLSNTNNYMVIWFQGIISIQ